jgi:hypothetical protein
MEANQNINSLSYFQDLLENDKSQILIQLFISNFVKNSGETILEIDNLKGVIKYYGQYFDDERGLGLSSEISYDFYTFFQNVIESETQKSKHLFNSIIHRLSFNGQSSNEYISLQKTILTNLKSKVENYYSTYPFISSKLNELRLYIENFDNSNFKKFSNSYSWDCFNETDKINLISNLYNLLKNNKIINSSLGEFTNAFTNGDITNGIKWLVNGKNNETSKYSIFYLIDQLQTQNFIEDINSNDYNKKIEYVFRDKDGGVLKNIRQSKSEFLKGSYSYTNIDDILSQL